MVISDDIYYREEDAEDDYEYTDEEIEKIEKELLREYYESVLDERTLALWIANRDSDS